MHFNNFLNEVATPISLGRAGYWLGRSYEEENNLLLSNYYYSLSSNYQSSFYGQLSSEKIDKKLRREFLLPYYEKNVGETDFQKSDIFRLAVLFQNVNEQELSRRFFSHFAERLTESEHLQLTNFLANLKNDYLALVLSKTSICPVSGLGGAPRLVSASCDPHTISGLFFSASSAKHLAALWLTVCTRAAR